MGRRVWLFVAVVIGLSGAAQAQEYCDKQRTAIAKARCRAVYQNRNVPEDVARAEASATHINWVYGTALSRDGLQLASAGRDQTVKLWDFASGKFIRNLGRHAGWVRAVAFSPDGKAVYSIADNEGLGELDAATGKLLRFLPQPAGENRQWSRLSVSPDGRFLALGGGLDRSIVLWDIANWTERLRLPIERGSGAFAFSPAASLLAWASGSGVRLFDLESGAEIGVVPTVERPSALAFSPDGSLLAVGGDTQVEIWDPKARKLVQRMPTKEIPAIFGLAVTPDNSIVVTGTDTPAAWDIATAKPRGRFGLMSDLCHSVEITGDGRYAVTSHMGSDIRLWDIASGALVRRFGEPVAQP